MPPRKAPRVRTTTTRAQTTPINENTNSADIERQIAERVAEAIATYEASRNNNGGEGSGTVLGHENPSKKCTYKEFVGCKARDFDGTGGAVAYTRWMEKMEAVIDLSNCFPGSRVKYVSGSLIGKALNWWNTQLQARGRDNAFDMAWDEFKALMKEEYCPWNEIQQSKMSFGIMP